MAGIYDEEKMKQKPVYPTRETPQYSDWALFNMGKQLEKVVDDLGPGPGAIIGTPPIVVTTTEGATGITLETGDGLKKDENDKLTLKIEDSGTLAFNSVTGELHANIFSMLKDGDDINYNSYGPALPRAVKPVITGKITDGTELLSTTSEHLVSAKAVKDALATKQNKMTAPTTGGLVITGASENLIGINFKSGGGVTYDSNGGVMIDDTVVQRKLTAGTGITIDQNNVISADSAETQITTVRVKVVGTGESGQPPSITINAASTYILDITSYVNDVTPSGYSILGQGTIFCTSLSPDGIVPMYFYTYQNRIMARLYNVSGRDLLCNNMWIEILFKKDN